KSGFAVEGMAGLIAPIQGDEVAGQFGDKFRVVQDDVAPKHHALAAGRDFAVDLLEEIEIDPAFAAGGAAALALAEAEVPGLVAADVEARAREVRQQLVIK